MLSRTRKKSVRHRKSRTTTALVPFQTNNRFLIPPPSKSIIQFTHTNTTSQHHPPSWTSTHQYQYHHLFSLLRSPPHLSETRTLHALLLVAGFFHPSATDTVLASQLLNVYVKFRCLHEALLVFRHLPRKNNIIAWNALLRGLVDAACFSQAIDFFYSMLTHHTHGLLVPDNFTYPLILKACSNLSALEHGRKVVELIQFNQSIRNLPPPNVYVKCAMIDMFAKCGSLDEAWMVFEEMLDRDLASWTAMICGTVKNGEWLQALCLFKRMRYEGIRPDSVIVAAILPVCSRLEAKQIEVGMALQGCAFRSGFHGDLFVSNALIDMYCKCGDTWGAYFIFCNMVCKDVISWSTLIAGYSQNSQYRESVELYLEMKKTLGERTNAVTVASVLPGFAKLKMLKQGKEMHSYILKQGFDCDVFVGCALIDMYANCGSNLEVECIFEIMSDKDIMIWNSVIAGHASNEDFDSAFRVFTRIWESQLRPNSITLMSILPMCTKMGALKQGKEIHGYATRSGLVKAISVGNSIIDMYCKCGYLKLGVTAFDNMMEKNVVTYNTIISAHGIHGYVEQALSFFGQMKAARVRPNKITFIGLLSGCSHAGLFESGWFLYSSMIDDYCLLPDMEHYTCMVDLLGRAGQLGDACNFIRSMPVEPGIDVLGSLLGACRIHNKVELADLVGRQLIWENLKDSGCHVLLSNIYASIGRWEDTSKIRIMIKEKGLIKKAGKSWIQIGHPIYMFKARDITHPEFDKIQDILESLLLEMKNDGYNTGVDPSFLFHDHAGDVEWPNKF